MRHFLGGKLWDLYSYIYDPITKPLLRKQRNNYIDLLLSSCANFDNLLVLGVGTGEDLLLLGDRFKEITCVDYSEKMLSRASRKHSFSSNISFLKMDVHNLSFSSGSFSNVLLPLIVAVARDPLVCLREASRVLGIGGKMLVFDKFLDSGGSSGYTRRFFNVFSDFLATSIVIDFHKLLPGLNLRVLREESSLIFMKTFLLERQS